MLFVRRAPAEVYLFFALAQLLLLAAGPVLGVYALVKRGNGGMGVIIPAVSGILISLGTLLWVAIVMLRSILR